MMKRIWRDVEGQDSDDGDSNLILAVLFTSRVVDHRRWASKSLLTSVRQP
jgi:hypothetical protein